MRDLFVFGTLVYPQILQALLGAVPRMADATLKGYRRTGIDQSGREAKGPILIADPDAIIEGKVLFQLSSKQARLIDLFEGAATGYRLISGTVALRNGGMAAVDFYVATDAVRSHSTNADWSDTDFERDYLEMYVKERIPALRAGWLAAGLI